MLRFTSLALVFAACATPAPDLAASAQAITDPIPQVQGKYALHFDASNGDQRGYILRLPAGYDPLRPTPYPLVMLFHGGGQSADSFSGRPGMQRMASYADAQGKILAFAQGTVNTAVTVPGNWDILPGSADLAYAAELTDFLASHPDLNADPARVLAAGFSKGGRLVHGLGAERPDLLLAIGDVAGYYGTTTVEPPAPPAGTLLPAYIVHGDADATVPIGGGDPAAEGGLRLSTLDTYGRWYANDACTALTGIPVNPPATHTFRFTTCRGSAVQKLRFTTVFGLGHSWPVPADGFDASAALLAFFDAL